MCPWEMDLKPSPINSNIDIFFNGVKCLKPNLGTWLICGSRKKNSPMEHGDNSFPYCVLENQSFNRIQSLKVGWMQVWGQGESCNPCLGFVTQVSNDHEVELKTFLRWLGMRSVKRTSTKMHERWGVHKCAP